LTGLLNRDIFEFRRFELSIVGWNCGGGVRQNSIITGLDTEMLDRQNSLNKT
jgi:hypothetical protein